MDLLENLKRYTDFSKGISNEPCELLYEDICLDNIVFTNYDLNNSKFLEVQFKNCNFAEVYLSGASLCGSLFEECIFENNIFKKGMADYARFLKSDFNAIDAFRTSFYATNFEDLKIENSLFKNCHIGRAKFVNVIFENTDLSKANFNDSVFENVTFQDCYLDETQFKGLIGLENTMFYNTNIMIDGELKTILGNKVKEVIMI